MKAFADWLRSFSNYLDTNWLNYEQYLRLITRAMLGDDPTVVAHKQQLEVCYALMQEIGARRGGG